MGQEGLPSTEASGILEEALASHTAPVANLHICSHSEVPGFFTTGNAIADKVASTHIFTVQQTHDLHSTLHIVAHALSRICSIPLSVAHDVVQVCPHCNSAPVVGAGVNPRGLGPLQIWRTHFTWEPCLSPCKWLAVMVDTSSIVIIATQHAKSNLIAVQYHWTAAIAVIGLPSHIKIDNGHFLFYSRMVSTGESLIPQVFLATLKGKQLLSMLTTSSKIRYVSLEKEKDIGTEYLSVNRLRS